MTIMVVLLTGVIIGLLIAGSRGTPAVVVQPSPPPPPGNSGCGGLIIFAIMIFAALALISIFLA